MKEALAADIEKGRLIDLEGSTEEPSFVAAVDTAAGWGDKHLYATAVIMSYPDLKEVERSYASITTRMSYRKGLEYYRVGQVIHDALAKLTQEIDLILVSGHGTAHPRRCGLACHIGLDFDMPTVGCARRLLAGFHRPVGVDKGSFEPIMMSGRQVGIAYRSKSNIKPIYISPGHKCDLGNAARVIVRCLVKHRLPEPMRLAHILVHRYKREMDRELIGKFPLHRRSDKLRRKVKV